MHEATSTISLSPEHQLWRRRALVATWLTYAGFYFCRKAFYVLKATIGGTFDLDASALADLGTVYLMAYTLGQFLCAWLGLRLGARLLLLLGMMLSVVCNIAFGLSDGYGTLMVFMILNGFAQATGWGCVIGVLANWTRRAERGTVLGIWGTCYQLGGVMANAWAAFWLHQQGWRFSFFAASAVLFGVWIYVLFFLREKPEQVGLSPLESEEEEGRAGEGGDGGWNRGLVITVALVGAFYFGIKFIRYTLWSWTPYFLELNYGLAGDDAGYLSTLFDMGGFAGVIFAGVVSDRFFRGRRITISLLMLVGMIGGCVLLATLGKIGVVWVAVGLTLVGFMLFGPDSLLTGAGAIDMGNRRIALTCAATINGLGAVGSVVQETVVSRVYDANAGQVEPIFILLVTAAVFSFGMLSMVHWRNRQGLSDL